MSQKVAVFDIDGTLFRSGLYREVIDELISTGKAPISLASAWQKAERDWKARTHQEAFKAFEYAMATAFDAALPRISVSDFEQAAATVVSRMGDYVYVYTRDRIATLKQQGYVLIAISGSQEELVKLFAKKYGFDIWVGQHYERGKDGFFTGAIFKTHDGKDRILQDIVISKGLTLHDSVGVGDTSGDIGMLSLVDYPIAFNPERVLFEHAKAMDWPIILERKNMIYRLEPHGHSYVLA